MMSAAAGLAVGLVLLAGVGAAGMAALALPPAAAAGPGTGMLVLAGAGVLPRHHWQPHSGRGAAALSPGLVLPTGRRPSGACLQPQRPGSRMAALWFCPLAAGSMAEVAGAGEVAAAGVWAGAVGGLQRMSGTLCEVGALSCK
jgi:hypothetical protein